MKLIQLGSVSRETKFLRPNAFTSSPDGGVADIVKFDPNEQEKFTVFGANCTASHHENYESVLEGC